MLELAVVDYRVYCLDGAGRIGFADWLSAADVEEAIAKARKLRPQAHRCEIWLKNETVARLNGSGEFERVGG